MKHGVKFALGRPATAVAAVIATVGTIVFTAVADPVVNPVVDGYGEVVVLPDAAFQPERGHRVVFDLTAASTDSGEVNPGLVHVARYVNLLGAAGIRPSKAPVAVVLHGDATRSALTAAAYERRFGRPHPDLDLVRQLDQLGVQLYVCGQALAQKDFAPSEVDPSVHVATSAMSALIELQMRRYALLPE